MSIKLTDLEKDVLIECNTLVNKYGLIAEKVKIKRSYYYYLTYEGKNILGNIDIVQFKTFCNNSKDIKQLSIIAKL